MNYLPPFTAIGMGNRINCPDTFVLTCFSKGNKSFRWQETLSRRWPHDTVDAFWGLVRERAWKIANATRDPHILLRYVYGTVDPEEAVRFDVYTNCEWVFLDVIRTCDEPEVRVEAAEQLANLRANGARYRALYAIPS